MTFHLLHKDFLRFLHSLDHEEAWKSYRKYYFDPHRKFLLNYWRTFRWMDMDQLKERVYRIKRGDYSTLEDLLATTDLRSLGEEALVRCMGLLPAPQEPDVYFMVGFFSADGFVIEFRGKPVIGFGLERFKSFRPLPIIFAHEYCHYLRSLSHKDLFKADGRPERKTLGEVLLAEGLSGVFSQLVFPKRHLSEHLFLPPERLYWCQKSEVRLRELIKSELQSPRLVPALFGPDHHKVGIPPRAGYYLGYRLTKDRLFKYGRESLNNLIHTDSIEDL